MKQRIGRTFGQGMLLRLLVWGAAGKHSGGNRFSRFHRTLIRVGIERHTRRIATAGTLEQSLLREVDSIVRPKNRHKARALCREMPGRDIPVRPGLARVLIQLSGRPGRRTHSVPGDDDDQLQLAGVSGFAPGCRSEGEQANKHP